MTAKTAVIALVLTAASTAWAGKRQGQRFDWDRYHTRQDACAEKDRLVEACARRWCDDLVDKI